MSIAKNQPLPIKSGIHLIKSYPRQETIINALPIAVLNRSDSNWHKMVGYLIKFKAQYGHCTVPRIFKENQPLANWVMNVKNLKIKCRLSEAKIIELSALGFNWGPMRNWEARDVLWQQRITEFIEFKQRYGHCLVTRWFEDYRILSYWVNAIRNDKTNGLLSKEKVAELERLGFIWEPFETIWQLRVAELKELYKQHGHCLVPKDNIVLNRWIFNIRQLNRRNKLPEEKINELNAISFIWEPRYILKPQRIAQT